MSHDKEGVEVKLEGGHDLELDGEGGDDTGGGVHPGHGGHLQVSLQHRNINTDNGCHY